MKFAGSISAKVVVLTVIAVLVAVAIGVAGWSAIGGLQGRVNRMSVVQRALHNQAEADGANYGIRYGVLATVTATTAKERKSALDDLAEQREILATSIGENTTLMEGVGAAEELRHEFANLGPAMADYLATSALSPTRSPTGPPRRRGRSQPSTPPMRSSTSDSTSSPPE